MVGIRDEGRKGGDDEVAIDEGSEANAETVKSQLIMQKIVIVEHMIDGL